jgi:hypothetical protein
MAVKTTNCSTKQHTTNTSISAPQHNCDTPKSPNNINALQPAYGEIIQSAFAPAGAPRINNFTEVVGEIADL